MREQKLQALRHSSLSETFQPHSRSIAIDLDLILFFRDRLKTIFSSGLLAAAVQ